MKTIELTQGQAVQVDDQDYSLVSPLKWRAQKSPSGFYAVRETYLGNGKTRPVFMHRFLLGNPDGQEVDHKDGDTLNNQRQNLRVCSHAQNMRNRKLPKNNTSGFKGVVKQGPSWRAEIKVNGKKKHLGCFKTKEEAAACYESASKYYFGDFVRSN